MIPLMMLEFFTRFLNQRHNDINQFKRKLYHAAEICTMKHMSLSTNIQILKCIYKTFNEFTTFLFFLFLFK